MIVAFFKCFHNDILVYRKIRKLTEDDVRAFLESTTRAQTF